MPALTFKVWDPDQECLVDIEQIDIVNGLCSWKENGYIISRPLQYIEVYLDGELNSSLSIGKPV